MTGKEKKQVIEALDIIYDWIDYTPEYYLERHDWPGDKKKIEKAKQIIKNEGEKQWINS